MKKILLASALFLFMSIFVPKQALGQNCEFVCSRNPGIVCPSRAPIKCIPAPRTVPSECEGMVVARCCSTESLCQSETEGEARVIHTQNPFGNCEGEAIDTAIGCIPIGDTNEFIEFILRWAIGIGGGIAFLLIVFAGFQIMTSAGNPERLKAGQELLTSAIAGLILLIFSVFILRIIGVNILGIFKP